MSDKMIWWGGPRPEADPVPLREAAPAALDAVRLAWDANPGGLLLLVGVQAASAAVDIAQLLTSGRAVAEVVEGEGLRAQKGRLLVLGGLGVAAAVGKGVRGAVSAPVTQAAQRRAEGAILDVVATLELADVEDPGFQDRLQRAFSAAQRQSTLIGSALAVPQGVVGLAGAVAAMTASDWALVPLGVAGSLPRWLLTRKAQDPNAALRGRARGFRESAILRHYLTTGAAHELRVFDASPFLRDRHDRLAAEADAVQTGVYRRNARRQVLGTLAGRLAEAPAAARLAVRTTRRETSVADAVTGGLAAHKLASTFERLVDSLNALRRAAAATADARDFVQDRPARRTGPTPPRHFTRIVVEDLCFTYPGRDTPVLDGVTLEIGQGEVVALVGENGSGKTTLAKLLCGLYRPGKGTIRWDEVDVAECDPVGVRSNIAVVFQDFVRYQSLTAAENIGMGLPSRLDDRDAIVDAARRAGAHDAIASLPKGYDTVLSRQFGGTDLSTGQWQRVALARAFLRDAPLVVLDEPTAALDPRAERDLFETVAALYHSRSAVLISHRLSSVRFADRICVLAGGRITESGSHEELLAVGGVYAELFELQAHAYR